MFDLSLVVNEAEGRRTGKLSDLRYVGCDPFGTTTSQFGVQ